MRSLGSPRTELVSAKNQICSTFSYNFVRQAQRSEGSIEGRQKAEVLRVDSVTEEQLKQQITRVTQSSQQQVTALEKTVKDCKKTIKDCKKMIETQKGTITALRLALQEAESENQLRRRPLTAVVDSSSLPAAAVAQQIRHDSAAHKANQKKQASSIYTHFR